MKVWERNRFAALCGRCGETIETGDPVLVVTIQGLKKRRLRCRACAGESPLHDLPPLVSHQVALTPMVPIRTGLGALPFTFKREVMREPGEDD